MDAVKCLQEFAGVQESYVSWRQAALAAYDIFKPYNGSSRHYQAVIIIRSKIRGPADAVLASFATVLNVEAIINRLVFTYSDKRPVHVIEQELGTLRQGNMPLLQYYDEVEKKLTLLINKVNMSYESALTEGLRDKFRNDALRVFVSGLKRSLTDVLFAAKPKDLPTTLALAQEIESNHESYAFAANFAKSLEGKTYKAEQKIQGKNQKSNAKQSKSPHFKQQQDRKQSDQTQSKPNRSDTPEQWT